MLSKDFFWPQIDSDSEERYVDDEEVEKLIRDFDGDDVFQVSTEVAHR